MFSNKIVAILAMGCICAMVPLVRTLAAELPRGKLELIAGLGKMTLERWRYAPPSMQGSADPALDDSTWKTVSPEFAWQGENTTVWFRKQIVLPEQIGGINVRGCRVMFRIDIDDGSEIYVNGELQKQFHSDEEVIDLTDRAEPGQQYLVAVKGINEGGPGRLLETQLEIDLGGAGGRTRADYLTAISLLENAAERSSPADTERVRGALASSVAELRDDILGSGNLNAINDCLARGFAALGPALPVLKKYTVHMIANAHIDSAWLWRWQESVEVCKATFRSALDIMKDTPDFTFACSSAAHYLWIEEYEPEMFEEIRNRVKEGRWEIVGGWWVQPDVNIPSGESFVRQALYGQRYFWEKFGRAATVGYNPDSFGHTGSLPQILAKCGLESYLFFRPGPHEQKLPSGLFWWEAPDGTRVLASRPPHHYNFSGGRENTVERIEGAFKQMPHGVSDVLCFYGVGDHGGGPTRETVAAISDACDNPALPSVLFGNMNEFYDRIRASNAELPVVRDELQHHASGCYAAHSGIKRRNRKSEELLLTAERLATFASAVAGAGYDPAELERAWRNVLFNQFHDILAGTSIAPVYDDAYAMYDETDQIAGRILASALNAIASRINTDGEGTALVVFNPLAWDRKSPLEVEIPWQHKLESLELRDAGGRAVAFQFVPSSPSENEGRIRIVFVADVPSLGYRVYRCVPVVGKHVSSRSPTDEKGRPALENSFWRIEIDSHTGTIARLFDKAAHVEVLAGNAAVPVVIEDMSDTWSHGVFRFHNEIGRFADARVSIIEHGPVRSVARIESRYAQSTIRQDLTVYEEVPGIECKMTVDWREQRKLLKLAFPVNVTNPTATYQIPYGYIERPADGEEEPAQQWTDVTGTAKSRSGDELTYGMSLLNDCKYSFDISEAVMSVTVLRSPPYALHDPRKEEPNRIYEYIDQGVQHLAYVLVPHQGTWQDAGTVRHAAELNAPVIPVVSDNHLGELPQSLSLAKVEPNHVALVVVKQSEDAHDIVLRLYETAGKATECKVSLLKGVAFWFGKIGANEIKTLKVTRGKEKARVVETDMLEGLVAAWEAR